MSKLYLDSANLDEIRRIAGTDAIAGVTTNPSLMAKEKKGDYHKHLVEIADILNRFGTSMGSKHLSVEVITLDSFEMFTQAKELTLKLGKEQFPKLDLHIKIPVTVDNLNTITLLENEGIKVNATACMMTSQAKLAVDAGASVVSFFYNRMKDGGDKEPERQIENFVTMRDQEKNEYTAYDELWGKTKSEIICGSIRRPTDVYECWKAGAEAVTVSMKIIELLMSHPQTDKAINGFQADIEKWLE